jgi:signal transduction histidine kinase
MTNTQALKTEKGTGQLGWLYSSLQPILEELVEFVGYRGALVALIDPDTNALEDVVGVNIPPLLLDIFDAPLDNRGPVAQALQARAVVQVDDALRNPAVAESIRSFYADSTTFSFAAIPLTPMPAVLVVSKDAPFTDKDVSTLIPHVSALAALLSEHLMPALHRESREGDFQEREWLWWMLNTVPDPIILSDDQNNILLQNVYAKRLLETKEDDSPGKKRAVELNNFLLSAALSSFALDQGEALGRELTLVDPIEGSDLLFEVICHPSVDARTNERSLITVLKNVTDLHRAVEEMKSGLKRLKESTADLTYEHDRLNLVLENVANPVIMSNQADEIILTNQAAARLLQTPGGGPHTRDRAAYYSNYTVLTSFLLDFRLDGADIKQAELSFINPTSGKSLAMNIAASKVRNEFGQPVATVSVLHDLTQLRELERRRLERQLFETEKLAAIGRVAAAVAHEINNPMEAIKNSLHLLVADLPADSPNRPFLDIANKEIMRVSGIIRQMLGLYRMDDAPAPLDVNTVVDEALTLLQRQLAGKNIALKKEMSAGLPWVHGSSNQLKQVFLNLFLNATEAMQGHGELRVVTRKGLYDGSDYLEGDYVSIEVHDTGVGIPAEYLSRIFEPFFSTKRDQHGTGLGLWVSNDIVRQHGGHIRVESRPGQGSTFTIALPMGENSD